MFNVHTNKFEKIRIDRALLWQWALYIRYNVNVDDKHWVNVSQQWKTKWNKWILWI